MAESPSPLPNVRQAVPFLWVMSIEDSLRFYIDGLGFSIRHRWDVEGKLFWCWLELGSAALMLQEFYRDGINTNMPQDKLGVGMAICWMCEDALAIYHQARGHGITASRPMVGNGNWEVTLVDPDGYRMVFESATDLPEETEYGDGENASA